MEKAYDIGGLVEVLKSKGLDLAEDGAKVVAESVFEWIEKSAKLSASPYDDMGLIVLPQLKKLAFSEIDKIDGKEG